MSGFENDIMFAKNADFTQADNQNVLESNGLAIDGQVWIGTTALNAGGTHVNVGTITSSTLNVGYSSPNITVESPGGVATSNFNVQANTAPGTDPVVPNSSGIVTVNGAAVANHSVVLETRSRAANAYNLEVQYATTSATTDATKSGVSHYNLDDFTVDANGFVSLADAPAETITGDTGGALSPTGGNFNIVGGSPLSSGTNASVTSGSGSTLTVTSINCAKWIVDPTANRGTHTTIAGAISAASSGETIFIRTGTYTENLTLKAGVNLTAFAGDGATPNVTIIGNATLSAAGTVSISNVRLQTNSAPLLTISGSVNSFVNLINCNLNCTNNTGISLTSSGLSAASLFSCSGDLATTGIAYFSQSSNSSLTIEGGTFTNSGGSTTASTATGNGNFIFKNVDFQNILSATTNSSSFILKNSLVNINSTTLSSIVNAVGVSLSGSSGTLYANNSSIGGGPSSAVSIGAGTVGHIYDCTINSSNTNAITGAGNISYSNIAFSGSSSTINTTTQTVSGTIQGSKNTAPTLGMLGEQIRSAIASGSALALTSGAALTITSISLTAGIWDVSGLINFIPGGSTTVSQQTCSVSPTNNTLGTQGDNMATWNYLVSITGIGATITVPSYRVTTASTITYYLVASATFAVSTMSAYGRISATRVG